MGRVLLGTFGGFALLVALCASQFVCLSSWALYGVRTDTCADGNMLPMIELRADSLRRGAQGSVRVAGWAWFTTGDADATRFAPMRRIDADLFLVDPKGVETKLKPVDGWDSWWGGEEVQAATDSRWIELRWESAGIELPDLPDGDYLLRAKVDTPLGDRVVDAKLPLYAPARIHLITDRPLYQPGDTVQFRALALRAADLSPLDGRPGTFRVSGPDGTVLMEEKAAAGDWGVVAGSFPLTADTDTGTWTVSWTSGEASAAIPFTVEPFRLPRFRVEGHADSPWYGAGETPTLSGRAVYSSGAPVAHANIRLSWDIQGDWPPPTSWAQGALPSAGETDANGAWQFTLPAIPADLQGQVTMAAALDVVDPAGDRVTGGVRLLLSQHDISVEAVTELGGGLVEGFNNRLYLRATTPDGSPMPGASLQVRRAWDQGDKGTTAVADEDGVAALQVDPGPPVTVVIPALPWRPTPRPAAAAWHGLKDMSSQIGTDLADRRQLEGLLGGLGPCATYAEGSARQVRVAMAVGGDGRISTAVAQPDGGAANEALAACVESALRGRSLARSSARVLEGTLVLTDPGLPTVRLSPRWVGEASSAERLAREATLSVRSCLDGVYEGDLPWALTLRTSPASRRVETGWVERGSATASASRARSCLDRAFSSLQLAEPATNGALGVATIGIQASEDERARRPQPTTMSGYELLVTASMDGEEIGSNVLRMSPGSVPDIRLRATPVLAQPGDTIEIAMLRGPGFSGELPEKLWMKHEGDTAIEGEVDPKARTTHFTLPQGEDGWFSVEWGVARALVFVAPAAELALDIQPEKPTYAPGDMATLRLHTTEGDQGVPAGVGLFGVDESLGQLVPLPGADALDMMRPQTTTTTPAFGAFEAQALSMGRIRGANAAAAVVLRTASLPTPEELDSYVSASGAVVLDPIADLTDRFYQVLGELHEQTRRWEAEAPKEEQMQPATMARLWKQAMAASAARDQPIKDSWGRPLRLHRLPPDLLALTDPRAVVIDGTRLPEDTEPWAAWVAEERP